MPKQREGEGRGLGTLGRLERGGPGGTWRQGEREREGGGGGGGGGGGERERDMCVEISPQTYCAVCTIKPELYRQYMYYIVLRSIR